MNFITKLLTTQIKEVKDVDLKKLRKELKKHGINMTAEEVQKYAEEYDAMLEERRRLRIGNISYVTTLLVLIMMAIQEFLSKRDILVFSDISQILFTIMGILTIGFTWLFYFLQVNKKYKQCTIMMIVACLTEIGLIASMCIL